MWKILGQSMTLRLASLAAVGWTVFIAGLFLWSHTVSLKSSSALALMQARSFFHHIVTVRFWNASHGGVYVPVTDDTQPNPFLEVEDRDIFLPDGRVLTKINPAYMTRMIAEHSLTRDGIAFHITSLRPIRPQNVPDPWEAKALERFEEKEAEVFSFTEDDGEGRDFRYMAPLVTEKPCLACHAGQGYEEGDIRGGISVTFSADTFDASRKAGSKRVALSFFLLWIVGLAGLADGMRRLHLRDRERGHVIGELEKALAEVKVLSGLLPICSGCKKIRDDKGYWHQIEGYIMEHSEAQFSHGLCQECTREFYPDLPGEDD